MTTGVVKFFNSQKGYGFIQPTDGSADVFVHVTALEQSGLSILSEGQKVAFEVVRDPRNGKMTASKIDVS
jgi:cold shock protein